MAKGKLHEPAADRSHQYISGTAISCNLTQRRFHLPDVIFAQAAGPGFVKSGCFDEFTFGQGVEDNACHRSAAHAPEHFLCRHAFNLAGGEIYRTPLGFGHPQLRGLRIGRFLVEAREQAFSQPRARAGSFSASSSSFLRTADIITPFKLRA